MSSGGVHPGHDRPRPTLGGAVGRSHGHTALKPRGVDRAIVTDPSSPEAALEQAAVPERFRSLGNHLWAIVPFVRPYKGRVAVGVATNLLARIFDLLPVLLIGLVIDEITQSGGNGAGVDWHVFAWYGAAVLGTFLGLGVFQTASDYAWSSLAQKVRHDIRVRIYDHMQQLDVAYFEDRQAGDLMSVLSNDVDNLENFIADATTSIIRLVTTFVGVYVILAFLSPLLALLLFLPMPFAIFAVRYFTSRVQPQYRRSREAVGAMNSILNNNLQGMGVIQAYTAERSQADRIAMQSGEYRDAAVAAARIRARFIPMLYLLAGIAFGVLIAAGGYLTFSGSGPSVGEFTSFILYAMRLIMPLFILGMLINQIQRSEASAKRIMDLLATESRITDQSGARPMPAAPRSVSFEGVHFAYRDGTPVLNGIDFEVRRGQVLGVVGHTGAGKSTILKLLLRYYEPADGRVLLDRHDLVGLQLASFRQHIGYVSQEAFLFSGTVRENIQLGSEDATLEDVRRAATIAGAAEFIDKLPETYDTVVGERGLKLSGGQRQRISLARAVLRDPAILILDEATSAVDTRTEELIQQNLHAFRKDRITIAVAHRLSTIRQADEILVMVDGVIVERGPHDALVAAHGVYADLWRVQSGQVATVSPR